MYSIIDIETTGTSQGGERITEIAVYNHDGTRITEEFSTLVNPEKKIPYRITQMTGISNQMVADAPRFCEIARKVLEMTEGRIFVAHNVGFDYGFVRQEYKNLGYDFSRDKLCTVRLSRKLVPGRPSYSLGNICADLGILINGRHRAAGDALATVKLFEHLLSIDSDPMKVNLKGTGCSVPESLIRALPEETGVYYFYNITGEIIYIGKSRNIHDRVVQHMHNVSTRKALEMRYAVQDISYELTGSDLAAQLLESEEIKRHMPLYNRQQRRIGFNIGIYSGYNPQGYLCLKAHKIKEEESPVTTFNSMAAAKRALFELSERHRLCQKLCGVYHTKGACFQHGIGLCDGACLGKEDVEAYNARVEEAIAPVKFRHDNFFITDSGRNAGETFVLQVHHGSYRGFGYFDHMISGGDNEFLASCIQRKTDTRDARQIIQSFLKTGSYSKLIIY